MNYAFFVCAVGLGFVGLGLAYVFYQAYLNYQEEARHRRAKERWKEPRP